MAFYVSVDAGGSKCSAILFDERYNLLGSGRSGGTNSSQGASPERVRKNVAECLDGLFKTVKPKRIKSCYAVFVGDKKILTDELNRHARVVSYEYADEIAAGLLAGAFLEEGLLALSGTGSIIGYIRKDPPLKTSLGGWGPILGDHGSGAWIGQRALRAVIAAHEGWGELTSVRELLKDAWELKNDWYLVNAVYRSDAPFTKVASVAPLVGEAARGGDIVSLGILREAGELMALQTGTLIDRLGFNGAYPDVVCCGGAWKSHGLMFGAFGERLAEKYPGITVYKPWFEHVIAGVVSVMIVNGVDRRDGRRILSKKFTEYVIDW